MYTQYSAHWFQSKSARIGVARVSYRQTLTVHINSLFCNFLIHIQLLVLYVLCMTLCQTISGNSKQCLNRFFEKKNNQYNHTFCQAKSIVCLPEICHSALCCPFVLIGIFTYCHHTNVFNDTRLPISRQHLLKNRP